MMSIFLQHHRLRPLPPSKLCVDIVDPCCLSPRSLSLYVSFDFLLQYLSFFLNEWSNTGQCIPCRLLGWHIRMMTRPQPAYLQNVSSKFTSLHALSDLISKLVSPTQTCSNIIIIIFLPNDSGIHSLKALVPVSLIDLQAPVHNDDDSAKQNLPREFGEEKWMISLCEDLQLRNLVEFLSLSFCLSVDVRLSSPPLHAYPCVYPMQVIRMK